jgi:hypothetical protein
MKARGSDWRHPRRQQVNMKHSIPKLATAGSPETSMTRHRTVIFIVTTVKNVQSQSLSNALNGPRRAVGFKMFFFFTTARDIGKLMNCTFNLHMKNNSCRMDSHMTINVARIPLYTPPVITKKFYLGRLCPEGIHFD